MSRFGEGVSYLGRGTLQIVLPSPCVACGGSLPWRDRRGSCCGACWRDLPRLGGVRCRRCGAPWEGAPDDAETFLCFACAAIDRDPIEWIDAWGSYERGLARLLHAFKFERHDFLDGPLATLLADRWAERDDGGFDAVVPIPLHRRRLAERGYNQAELLARRFAAEAGIPVDPSLLRRAVDTPPQSKLHRDARAANVKSAFIAVPAVCSREVLLIDDVCTTGATLRAAAKALRRAGARRVAALTVARA